MRQNLLKLVLLFFPSKPNVARLVKYIAMAKRTIDLCIFSFTNDDLANEIIRARQRGEKVRIITDSESMHGKGADAPSCSDPPGGVIEGDTHASEKPLE